MFLPLYQNINATTLDVRYSNHLVTCNITSGHPPSLPIGAGGGAATPVSSCALVRTSCRDDEGLM
jgi:hypothetical protein